jgi:hypothetical protein
VKGSYPCTGLSRYRPIARAIWSSTRATVRFWNFGASLKSYPTEVFIVMNCVSRHPDQAMGCPLRAPSEERVDPPGKRLAFE